LTSGKAFAYWTVMSAEASDIQNKMNQDEIKNIYELWEINVTSAQYKRFFYRCIKM